MPGYRGHIAGGIAAHILIEGTAIKFFASRTPTLRELFIAITFVILGALFPDIDTKSIGQRLFYMLLTIPIIYSIMSHHWEMLIALSLISLFPAFIRHRGIMHTVWFVCLVPLCIPFMFYLTHPHVIKFAWLAYKFFVIGALSHLILDYGAWRLFKRTIR